MPFFGFEAGEEELSGVHQASEDFVSVAGDVAEFVAVFGDDEDGEGIVRVLSFAPQHERIAAAEGGFDFPDGDVGGAGDVGFDEVNFLGEGCREPAAGLQVGVEQCELVLLGGGEGEIAHGVNGRGAG